MDLGKGTEGCGLGKRHGGLGKPQRFSVVRGWLAGEGVVRSRPRKMARELFLEDGDVLMCWNTSFQAVPTLEFLHFAGSSLPWAAVL